MAEESRALDGVDARPDRGTPPVTGRRTLFDQARNTLQSRTRRPESPTPQRNFKEYLDLCEIMAILDEHIERRSTSGSTPRRRERSTLGGFCLRESWRWTASLFACTFRRL